MRRLDDTSMSLEYLTKNAFEEFKKTEKNKKAKKAKKKVTKKQVAEVLRSGKLSEKERKELYMKQYGDMNLE